MIACAKYSFSPRMMRSPILCSTLGGGRGGEEDFMVLVSNPGERYDKHGAYIVRVHTYIKRITLLEI